MIRRLVDVALNNRLLMVSLGILLLLWGAISFHSLPVEAYPDVANNYVNVITQWPGRAAEEVEQQLTMPQNLQPVMGTDWSPVGQIYFYTLHSANPAYDVMELKALQDWMLEKQLKSVPNVVDVSSLGGETKEYQVRVNPNKLIEYGLSIAQVE